MEILNKTDLNIIMYMLMITNNPPIYNIAVLPFTPQFCRPTGWALTRQREQPEFFVAVLTDVDADRHYCACLTFSETITKTNQKHDDPDGDGDDSESSIMHHSLLFAPKSLVLVSRLDYFDVFRVSHVLCTCTRK